MPESDDPKPGWSGERPMPDLNRRVRPAARELRQRMTRSEVHLWVHLRGRQRLGYKFRRQHVIDRFVVDFYCADARLVIELDGAVHRYTGDRDVDRQAFLESLGLRVLRFTNDDVWDRLDGVVEEIDKALRESAGGEDE